MKETQIPALPTNDAGATHEVLACETAGREQELLFMVRGGNESLPSGTHIAHMVDGRMIHYESLEYPEEFAEEMISFWARDTTPAGQRELRRAIDLVFRSLDEVDPEADPVAYAQFKLREKTDHPDVLAIWLDGEWGVTCLLADSEKYRHFPIALSDRPPGDSWHIFGAYKSCNLWPLRDRLTKYGRKMLLHVIDVD